MPDRYVHEGALRYGALMRVGAWYLNGLPLNSGAGASKPNGDARGGRINVVRACTLDAIMCEITTAGEAGSLVRLALYDDNQGTLGSLILDAGTVAADTTGVKTIAITQSLPAAPVWAVAALQNATTTRPNIRQFGQADLNIGVMNSDFRFPVASMGTVTGAFPASGGNMSAADVTYMVGIKASA